MTSPCNKSQQRKIPKDRLKKGSQSIRNCCLCTVYLDLFRVLSSWFWQDSSPSSAAAENHLTRQGGLGLSVVPGSLMATLSSISETVVWAVGALNVLWFVKVMFRWCPSNQVAFKSPSCRMCASLPLWRCWLRKGTPPVLVKWLNWSEDLWMTLGVASYVLDCLLALYKYKYVQIRSKRSFNHPLIILE